MSQSPYIYDNKKGTKPVPTYSNDASVVGSGAPLLNYNQRPVYTQYQQQQQRPQQQQQAQQQVQQQQAQQQQQVQQQQQQQQQQAQVQPQQAQAQQSQQPQQLGRGTGYLAAPSYSHEQQQLYAQMLQQQSHQPNLYQPQQPYPQYAQSSLLGSSYGQPGVSPAYQPAAVYGYPALAYDTASQYKQPSAGGVGAQTAGAGAAGGVGIAGAPAINMTNIRGGLQSASAPPLVDPNQVPQRPKLTTTYWEDENTVCYQVESRGISVSRREDTNFINGTKLLNVAGMTRGRRDGILKSEKIRYVVKIGAMNLKGVWIPFERALELARNEGIVDLLYPLFVKDIKELYQGPQYSGGLTAAANSNLKNMVPVTVTNSTYTPGAYSKEKKAQQGTPTPGGGAAPAAVQQPQPDQPLSYSYGYQYPASTQYAQPTGYYGYQQPAPAAATEVAEQKEAGNETDKDGSAH